MALQLGAKYKSDWDKSCTHLICAYKNTPKYNKVKSLGKIIVKRDWVENCYQLKKRIPWRRFALDDRESTKSNSDDDEILDESFRPSVNSEECDTEVMNIGDVAKNLNVPSSGEDTDDDLDRARNKMKDPNASKVIPDSSLSDSSRKSVIPEKKTSPSKSKQKKKTLNEFVMNISDENIFDVSTDEEEFTLVRRGIFSGKKISLSSNLGAVERVKLRDLLLEHKAVICDTGSNANVIISTIDDKEFSVPYVAPRWVYESCDMKCLLPTMRYLA